MTSRTHAIVGVAAAVPIVTVSNFYFISFALMGALFPDIDIKAKVKHRGFTHSLLCICLLYPLIYYFTSSGALFFTIGFISHLVLDMLTKRGIALFYPIKMRVGLKLFRTGGTVDHMLRYIAAAVAVLFFIQKL
jgi:inner membrane protein